MLESNLQHYHYRGLPSTRHSAFKLLLTFAISFVFAGHFSFITCIVLTIAIDFLFHISIGVSIAFSIDIDIETPASFTCTNCFSHCYHL